MVPSPSGKASATTTTATLDRFSTGAASPAASPCPLRRPKPRLDKRTMDEDELQELQDPANWDYESAELCPPAADAGAIIAVRFTADEFGRVVRHAAEAGVSLASFVHGVVLEEVSQPTTSEVIDS